MFITKKHLSRRTMLRGMGAAVALPFLESMVPAQTPITKTAAAPKARLACIEMVHGAAGSTVEGGQKYYWSPATAGSDFEMGESLKPLQGLREYVTIVSHTDLKPANAATPVEVGGDHFRSSATFLTASHSKMTEGADIYQATSIDQLYAQQFGQDTPLPSIQLSIESTDGAGACDYGYSCVYSDTISWASPKAPLPMTRDPRQVFESLFGDGGTAAQRAIRLKEKQSILDKVMRDVARLRKELPSSDQNRLVSYLDDLREIERRIQRIEAYNSQGNARELPTAPVGVPDSFEEHVALMFDLQALAFQAGITRVSAFKMSRDVCQRVYPESGIKTSFHSASHHGEASDKLAEFAQLNQYHVSKVAYFLEKLKNTSDGDGNLLDHSLVLYGSPMGDSNVHNHIRVPIFLAGHASGTVKGNLHVIADDGTPMANILLTILHKVGVSYESFGDSTGVFSI
jgi:Protein of unknown function (DUF1552)